MAAGIGLALAPLAAGEPVGDAGSKAEAAFIEQIQAAGVAFPARNRSAMIVAGYKLCTESESGTLAPVALGDPMRPTMEAVTASAIQNLCPDIELPEADGPGEWDPGKEIMRDETSGSSDPWVDGDRDNDESGDSTDPYPNNPNYN